MKRCLWIYTLSVLAVVEAVTAPSSAPAAKVGSASDRPNLAVAGKASASSEESGKGNYAGNAIDGDPDTRWCAGGAGANHTWQVDLGKEQKITAVLLNWESQNNTYRYRLEGSADGQQWKLLADAAKNEQAGPTRHDLDATVRHVRMSFLGSSQGGWGSLWEVAVLGEKGAPQPAVIKPTPNTGKKGNQPAKSGDKEPPVLPSIVEVEKMKPVTADKSPAFSLRSKQPQVSM